MEKRNETNEIIEVNGMDSLMKWKDKIDDWAELLPSVGKQCSVYFDQISEAVSNLATFFEQNKDMVPFLKVGLIAAGEIEILGKKMVDLKAVTGVSSIVDRKIDEIVGAVKEKESA